MRTIFLVLLYNLLTIFVFAQSPKGKVAIAITNEQNNPVENATAELLRTKDSALVKTSLSDKSGIAEFESIVYGSYIIRISHVGFATRYSTAFSLEQSSINLPAIDLVAKTGAA